jgi:hypothetical protein
MSLVVVIIANPTHIGRIQIQKTTKVDKHIKVAQQSDFHSE